MITPTEKARLVTIERLRISVRRQLRVMRELYGKQTGPWRDIERTIPRVLEVCDIYGLDVDRFEIKDLEIYERPTKFGFIGYMEVHFNGHNFADVSWSPGAQDVNVDM